MILTRTSFLGRPGLLYHESPNFAQKSKLFKNTYFPQKSIFPLLSKISIFSPNFDFCAKFQLFRQISGPGLPYNKNPNFAQKSKLFKNPYFPQKSKFLSKNRKRYL